MEAKELGVVGAHVFTPQVFADSRGAFVSPFQEEAFVRQTGHRLFPVEQISHSRSRRGVVRGVHFTRTPPGMAKYVYCPRGRALDIIVDLRRGSPTFGRHATVVLDPVDFRAVYFPVGLGHAFVALEDDTVMAYTLSLAYAPENELALSVYDPDLALSLPEDIEPVVSERDRVAQSLEQALESGVLPDYEQCLELDAELAR
ncbi:dTDP-4-dehydrorhamnose 3,5-epimerase family protein [Streptomyces rubiginosohelvolus]|uniref:dTDP-4-dehydrorhamnose 3,5-epimerase family protein n=1 Tax=Streptomyces TaxID=1883 RepID=UPI000BFE49DA|nr:MULTISPECIES: dTDP-4-dehydrorhamnose 3,5-epimerase family protein [unclassified Streptomyces]RUP64411.1 dTDP-4-dehydrorhamnose 3,5-epimerase [Streptomyces sp. NP10]WST51507.1 dTDP-4-dehydrorhamnose 3,5-epimerase family protein [Streptomyces rubiginosohelvolus]